MAIAAIPEYVARQSSEFPACPPGHKFNLYFPIWRDDWSVDKTGKAGAIQQCVDIPDGAKRMRDALVARQRALAAAAGALALEAKSLAPFATGLGLEHPVENGFAFLTPYGLPYLAGSGAKGVFRRAAEELAREENAPLTPAEVDTLFGPQDTDDAQRGALTFWDVFPQCPAMSVEIMTPHHGEYYQKKGTPNDAGQPNPIPFLAVPPDAKFLFVVACDERLAGSLAGRWRDIVTKIFSHACDWRGFGAKTAVGYGALALDLEAIARAREEQMEAAAQAARNAELARLTPNVRRIEEFKQQFAARAEQLRGNKERANTDYHNRARALAKAAVEGADWTADEKRMAADAIDEWLPQLVDIADMRAERKKLGLTALRGA